MAMVTMTSFPDTLPRLRQGNRCRVRRGAQNWPTLSLSKLLARVGVVAREGYMSAVIYVVVIGVVAAMLFRAVNNVEPNRRYASVLKLLIVFCERCGNRRKSDALIARYTYPEVRLSYAQRYHHLTGGPYLMGNTSFCGQAIPARDKYRCPSLTDQQGPRSQQRRSASFRQ